MPKIIHPSSGEITFFAVVKKGHVSSTLKNWGIAILTTFAET